MMEPHHNWLACFPITFFTTVMGMGGLTLALRAAEKALALDSTISSIAFVFTLIQFLAILVIYTFKALRHPGAVLVEWNHPEQIAFFPAISISLLLLSAAMLDVSQNAALAIWSVGAVLQAVLTLAVITDWISTRTFQRGHLSPAWFIPVVGNVIVTFAGVPLGFIEVSWFFLSVGLLFWLVLLTLVINRLIFHDPLSERLQPTLVILIAPPALGFLGWTLLTGAVDPFARIMLNGAYLFALIVVLQLPRFLQLPFSLSFWALSFPAAALTTASFVYAELTGSAAHRLIGFALLAFLCTALVVLLTWTYIAIRKGELFRPA